MGAPEFINLRKFSKAVPDSPLNFLMDHNALSIARKESNEIRLHFKFGRKIKSGKAFNISNAY